MLFVSFQKTELAKFSISKLFDLINEDVMDGYSLAGRKPRTKLSDQPLLAMMAGKLIQRDRNGCKINYIIPHLQKPGLMGHCWGKLLP